jgi:hypothetical protein
MRWSHIIFLLSIGTLAGCTPPPPIMDSREVLWQQFGNKPLDELLVAWGPPTKETTLTDGSRMVVYRRSVTYDAGSYSENFSGCEVTFLAKPRAFNIHDIAMEGDARLCQGLAQGQVGDERYARVDPWYPRSRFYGGYGHGSYMGYSHGF